MKDDIRSFDEQGIEYQEMVCRALFEDQNFAETIHDVLDPEHFSFAHLKSIVKTMFNYRQEFKVWPSSSVVFLQLRTNNDDDEALLSLLRVFEQKLQSPLKGDLAWIEQSSLEFCRRQNLLRALGNCLDMVDGKRYDNIAQTVRRALDQGSPADPGHQYSSSLELRTACSERDPISTGWPVLDVLLNGGYERGTITTFIAPTGAGKTMFMVNAACALVEQGLNVLYVTLEMHDWKIGLRADSWFSGIAIDDIKDNEELVRQKIAERARGNFIIKQWPTKKASVETIRTFVQKTYQNKGIKFDAIVVDYPDLLKPTKGYGEKRHELEGNYEELRGLSQEENCIMIVADQTNRSGLDSELVTIASVAEAYSKMTVCDLILTVSRTPEMKVSGTGNLFIAKSRLGRDGIVLPFLLDTGKNVIVRVLDNNSDAITTMMKTTNTEVLKDMMRERVQKFSKKKMERLSEVEGTV